MSCVKGCCATQREHYLSIAIGAAATPSRQGAMKINRLDAADKKLSRDLDAYKTLRKQGVQPDQIEGSAELAVRASSKVEIEAGKVLTTKRQRKQYRDVMEAVNT